MPVIAKPAFDRFGDVELASEGTTTFQLCMYKSALRATFELRMDDGMDTLSVSDLDAGEITALGEALIALAKPFLGRK